MGCQGLCRGSRNRIRRRQRYQGQRAAANFRKGVYKLKRGNTEIFGITKWGSTFNVYSYLKVWIMFDGNFVSTTPAPSVKGQHCGLCGNYNRNKWDDMMGKDMTPIKSVQDFVADYKWKC